MTKPTQTLSLYSCYHSFLNFLAFIGKTNVGKAFLGVFSFHESFGVLSYLSKINALLLRRKNTATVALTVDIILIAHFNRATVAIIFFEITWQILSSINFLHVNAHAIDELRIFMRTNGQGTGKIVKTKLHSHLSCFIQTVIKANLATVATLRLFFQTMHLLEIL